MKNNFILSLYKKPQTVFTLKEISLLFPKVSYQNLRRKVSYFAKTGKIKRLRKGVYAKDNFDSLELANKIYTPSYISLETVLQKEGVIFQNYKTIFVASYLSRKIKVAGHDFFYRKIKDAVLLNNLGIAKKNGYFMATKERAFLDSLFIYKDYHFNNLGSLDWKKVMKIKEIYSSKALEKRVDEYYKIYKEEHVC